MPYVTSDVYLVATLVTLDYPYDRYSEESGRFTFIWINDQESVKELADQYYKDELQVPALSLSNSIKTIKTVCHSMPHTVTSSSPNPRKKSWPISASLGKY